MGFVMYQLKIKSIHMHVLFDDNNVGRGMRERTASGSDYTISQQWRFVRDSWCRTAIANISCEHYTP